MNNGTPRPEKVRDTRLLPVFKRRGQIIAIYFHHNMNSHKDNRWALHEW